MLPTIQKSETPFERQTDAFLKDLLQRAETDAKTYGLANQPPLTGNRMAPYVEPFHHEIQNWIHRQAELYKPETAKHTIITNKEDARQKLHELLNKRGEAEFRKKSAASQLHQAPIPLKRKHKQVLLLIAGIGLFEGLLAQGVFESWGFTKLESLISAPLFALVFAILAHFMPHMTNYNRLWKRVVAIAIITAALGIVFWYLGLERATYLTVSTGIEHSPLPFYFFSFLLITASALLSYYCLPFTDDEKREIQAYDKLVEEKREADEEYEKIEAEIAAISNARTDLENNGAITFETGHTTEQRLISTAHQMLSLYRAINLKHRTDGTPECFTEPYPFTFTTYFNYKQSEQ